jgi:type I restriction enzyme S subunit
MNAELLLEHFHRLGDAPDAVPRLRRFILDLAVRGKLVNQDERSETAPDLLKRIGIPCADESAAFELPKNWAWIRCASLMHERAETINPLHHPDEEFVLWSVPSFATGRPEIVAGRAIGASKPAIEPGVILLSRINPHLNRVWVTHAIPGYRHIASSEWIVLKPTGLLPEFLMWSLRSPFFFEQFCSVLTGIGGSLTRVRPSDAAQYLIAIPPLAEQHRIVAKVDELMALCDTLEAAQQQREQQRTRLTAASWQAVVGEGTKEAARFALEHLTALTTRPEQVKALRQTILDLAVRGKLVEQDPKDEPASVLLKKIAAEKERLVKGKSIRKQTDYENLTDQELPCGLPANWTWQRVGQIGYTQTGTTPSSANSEFFGDYIPFVKPGDMDGPTIDYSGPGISELGVAHSRLIPANSVLMVCVGSTIGKVNRCDREICCNQQINTLTPYLAGLSTFLHYAMKSPLFQKMVKDNAGMGTLPILSKGKWEQLPIPLPPLAEQGRIVAKVDALMGLCDTLEAALRSGEELKGRLLEAVLASGSDNQPIRRSENLASPKASRRRSGMRAGLVPQQKPARSAQPKVAAAPMPVYAEVEDALNLAAEPAGSFAPKRGRGRPCKDAQHTASAATNIAAYLKEHPGWHAKSAVLAATGVDAAAWNAAIKALLEAGAVERQGEKKGARYRAVLA